MINDHNYHNDQWLCRDQNYFLGDTNQPFVINYQSSFHRKFNKNIFLRLKNILLNQHHLIHHEIQNYLLAAINL